MNLGDKTMWTRERVEMLLIAGVFLLLLLPFLNKPAHIDDPLYIWTAQHVVDHPLDPYGFEANWAYAPKPMYESNQNPPLTAYYLAVASLFLGWSEAAMHFAMLAPAMAFGLGVYFLAGEFCKRPLLAGLAAVTAPGVVLSATTIMTDVPMAALYVWALYFWSRGLQTNNWRFLALSGVLAGLAFLAKYFAFSLIPLIAVFTMARGRRNWKSLAWLGIPAAVICAYQWGTANLYGVGLFSGAVGYANEIHAGEKADLLGKALTGIAFLGGCFGTYWFLLLAIRSRRALAWSLAGTGLLFVAIWRVLSVDWFPFSDEGELVQGTAWHLAFFITCGLQLIWLAGRSVWAQRDAESLTLCCWIAGTLFYACFLNHFVNARVILPLLPAVAILIARELDRAKVAALTVWWKSPVYLALIPSVGVSLAVCCADASLARTAKRAAEDILAMHDPARIRFSGHWGFHYYMEKGGASVIDGGNMAVDRGTLLVTPSNNASPIYVEPERIAQTLPGSQPRMQLLEYQPLRWLATMDIMTGAGFHSAVWGPVPYQFESVPTEQYALIWVDVPPGAGGR